MSCSQSETIPEHLLFVFSSGPTLEKKQDLITIAAEPHWTDAQVPPPDDFDWSPMAVLISGDEGNTLWSDLVALDLAPLNDPGDDAFELAPPDVSHVERLRFEIDNAESVGWSFDGGYLKPEFRAELDSLNARLRELFDRRREEPTFPDNILLRLEEAKNRKTAYWELTGNRDSLMLNSSAMSQPQTLTSEDLGEIIRALQDSHFIGRWHRPSPLTDDSSEKMSTCRLTLRLNNVDAADIAITSSLDDKQRFDRLREMLEQLSKK